MAVPVVPLNKPVPAGRDRRFPIAIVNVWCYVSTMLINDALQRLQRIYDLHERFCADQTFACRRGCAPCCTANVTLTTLEARAIERHWARTGEKPPIARLQQAARHPRFRPRLTTNQLAAICAAGGEPPDEAADPAAGPCPLLNDTICTIYPARPFGCRAMVSHTDCARHGTADMPDRVLAANTLFLQFIESLDQNGRTGNLTDLLLWRLSGSTKPPTDLAANRTIPVLMVPPEQHTALQPLLGDLRPILAHLTG